LAYGCEIPLGVIDGKRFGVGDGNWVLFSMNDYAGAFSFFKFGVFIYGKYAISICNASCRGVFF